MWHAVALLPISLACYVSSRLLFGDIVYHSAARLPIMLLGTALFAIFVLLTVAAIGRSKKVLRLALITAFVLDMQAFMVLYLYIFQIDNASLLGGIPIQASRLVLFLALAVPAAVAVFALREKLPVPADGAAPQ